MKYKLDPHTIVALEGPDNCGKSSVAKALQGLLTATYTHMPSGKAGWSKAVYGLLEGLTQADKSGMPTISRQLLHLACHHEHFANEIAPALKTGGVVMDRCWASAYVYGWMGDSSTALNIDHDDYVKLIKTPLSHIHAGEYHSEDLLDPEVKIFVYYLGPPYKADPHNTPAILLGYNTMDKWYEQLFPGEYIYLPGVHYTVIHDNLLTPEERALLIIEDLGVRCAITKETQ